VTDLFCDTSADASAIAAGDELTKEETVFRQRLLRVMTVAAVAIVCTLSTATAAGATSVADRTPPTAPFLGYAEGFQCTMLIVGIDRSTDAVTPQSQLRYQVYSDGVRLGAPLADTGSSEGVWAVMHFQTLAAGYHTVAVRAIDAAGNRSALSNADTVREYYTPGCAPGHL